MIGLEEIVQPAIDTLTEEEVSGTLINNLGQDAENTQTLPTATKGLNFIFNVSEFIDYDELIAYSWTWPDTDTVKVFHR